MYHFTVHHFQRGYFLFICPVSTTKGLQSKCKGSLQKPFPSWLYGSNVRSYSSWLFSNGRVELSCPTIDLEGVTCNSYTGKHHLTLTTLASLVLGTESLTKTIYTNKIYSIAVLHSVSLNARKCNLRKSLIFQPRTRQQRLNSKGKFSPVF